MKNIFTIILISILFIGFKPNQNTADAVIYFKSIFKIMNHVSSKQMKYSRSVIYKRRDAVIENKKQKLLKESKAAIKDLEKIGPFEGNSDLVDQVIEVLKKSTGLMENELEELSQLNKTAYDSYDNMVVYIGKSQELINKMSDDQIMLLTSQYEFADEFDFELSDNQTRLAKQLKITGELDDYMTPIYLAVFKVEKDVVGLFEALDNNDFESAEEFRELIIQDSKQSLSDIREEGSFKGSMTYSAKASGMVRFYQQNVRATYIKLIDYYKKGDKMTKTEYKQYTGLMKNYNTSFNQKNSDYYNYYYEFQQKYVSRF